MLTRKIKERERAEIADAVSTVSGIHCAKPIKEQPYRLNKLVNTNFSLESEMLYRSPGGKLLTLQLLLFKSRNKHKLREL